MSRGQRSGTSAKSSPASKPKNWRNGHLSWEANQVLTEMDKTRFALVFI